MARPRDPERLQKFSRWLRIITPTKGFDSQRQLAIKAGVNEATVSRIWNATQLPDELTLAKIAGALDVDVKEALRQAGYLVHEKLATPEDFAGENIGEVAKDNALEYISAAAGIIELTDILKIENENKITYMGMPFSEDDIIITRDLIEAAFKPRLPKVIPIYPPPPPRDYSKIPKIEDIDPEQVPLPIEFMCRGERINRYEYFQAEGRLPTDDDWKHLVHHYKYNPPK